MVLCIILSFVIRRRAVFSKKRVLTLNNIIELSKKCLKPVVLPPPCCKLDLLWFLLKFSFQPLGDLGTLEADEDGKAFFSGTKDKLRVSDLIGRSIAVYSTEDKSDKGLTAAVIARSAGVGENYKKLCTCDGTTIWEASDADFVTSKV